MNISDLAKLTFALDTNTEETKKELIAGISDVSIQIIELIRHLQEKIDTLMKEKPENLLEELSEATYMLYLYLELYSDDAFEVEP
jgi:phenylpyruvate tautomerase PptA (4-oxalocrotonate tautomerase family)